MEAKFNLVAGSRKVKEVKTPHDATRALLAYYIDKNGGEKEIERVVQKLKDNNQFSDPKDYTRFKHYLKKCLWDYPVW